MAERVQKILSQWGIASRRQAEKLIQAGRVSLNGQVVHLGQKADPHQDNLCVDGQVIHPENRPQHLYLLLNKPKGVISTCDDPRQRQTVLDCLPPHLRQGQGLHPVGRLDRNSTGALLLTNDGELTLGLTHPRYHLPKTYQVWVTGKVSSERLAQWREGVSLDGQTTLPATVEILDRDSQTTCLKIILREGKNRQIRRVAQQLGLKVIQLHRQQIGPIQLNFPNGQALARGQYRELTPTEVQLLHQQVQKLMGKLSTH